jgi:endonuclease/exonuclease/phosphatase (EEP) superfamily protein YafD
MPTNPPQRTNLSLWGLIEAGAMMLCAATVTSFLGRVWWLFSLPTHFPLHLGVALAAVASASAIRRRWRVAVICGGFALVNLGLVVATLWPPPPTAGTITSGARLRLAALNVHTANERTDLVLGFLRQADADVILLMEVDERWMAALAPLDADYPHQIAAPREDNFGIELFSRLPLTNAQVLELGSAELPSLSANFNLGGREVLLLGTHPLPPGTAEYSRQRNEQLRALAAHVREQRVPVMVLGDLNTTPWSPFFADLLRGSGLRQTSRGRGLCGTWPASLPVGRIALDHCLLSPVFAVASQQVGPKVGGDHLPLVVEVQWRE